MSEPRFKAGDKAEFELSCGWVPVLIESHALRWASPYESNGFVYLAQHIDLGRGKMPFLVHSSNLRPAEQWKRCEGIHRVEQPSGWAPSPTTYNDMERLVP